MCFINYTEMARVTGVPFNYLLARGQSIKVLSQLYRRANEEDYVIPNLKSEGVTTDWDLWTTLNASDRFRRTIRGRDSYRA